MPPETGGGISGMWELPRDDIPPAEVEVLPSEIFLTSYLSVLACGALVMGFCITRLRKSTVKWLLHEGMGVTLRKLTRTAKEIERKTFHLAGLVYPLIYQVLLCRGWSKENCCSIVWTTTICLVSLDYCRVRSEWLRQTLPWQKLMREQEKKQLCGGTYFSVGCAISIQAFAPAIAITSIIFLVMGDMSAALIGRSFGQTFCSLKIGPGGKKSVEGSAAMFIVCFVFGVTIFSEVYLREYAIALAALTATLVELWEPMNINDNITIPVLTSIALTVGFARTYSCDSSSNPLEWYKTV